MAEPGLLFAKLETVEEAALVRPLAWCPTATEEIKRLLFLSCWCCCEEAAGDEEDEEEDSSAIFTSSPIKSKESSKRSFFCR